MKSLFDFNCPAICKVYNAFYRENKIHFILEYMNGGSLESLMNIYGPLEEPILSKMTYWVNSLIIHF
jgi:serine/threonine protein kinase